MNLVMHDFAQGVTARQQARKRRQLARIYFDGAFFAAVVFFSALVAQS